MSRSLARTLLFAALLCLLVTGSLLAQSVQDVVLFKNPKPSPALKVRTFTGQALDLQQLRGKVVLLNFWATWCGPCRMEIPEFEQLQKQYMGKLQIVGLSVDEESQAKVQKVADALHINYPVAMASADLQRSFGGMPAIPVTFVIDQKGQIEQRHVGANPYPVFNNEVRALLGLPVAAKVMRIDQLSPNGKVGTIDIPGIADILKTMTPQQRQEALKRLNEQACTCGCNWSLATCRVQDPSCGYSLPQAKELLEQIRAGH